MIICAYAKVNISLKIVGRRDDGFHLLESYMQALPELYDVLEIVESDKTEISCSDKSLSCGPDNLVSKALALIGKNAKVHIEKRIPIAAGLAGGSADAAAVLFAFEGAGDLAFEHAKMLGSDVPFSLLAIKHQGKVAAFATGTGTELEITDRLPGRIITKTPKLAVSTPLVYKEYDRLKELGFDFTPYENDLQPAAISLFPEIQSVIDELKQTEDHAKALPRFVRQSGSGPTCFAVYDQVEEDYIK